MACRFEKMIFLEKLIYSNQLYSFSTVSRMDRAWGTFSKVECHRLWKLDNTLFVWHWICLQHGKCKWRTALPCVTWCSQEIIFFLASHFLVYKYIDCDFIGQILYTQQLCVFREDPPLWICLSFLLLYGFFFWERLFFTWVEGSRTVDVECCRL